MAKEEYLELGKDVSGFEVKSSLVDNAPEGLTPKILWDLWDIGVKFGTISSKGIYFVLKENSLALEIYKSTNEGGCNGFVVAKARPSLVMDEGVYFFKLKNGMGVIWDNGLIVQDVVRAIEEIDIIAKKRGHIEGSERKIVFRPNKMSVGIFLEKRGYIMLIMPHMNVDEILSDFDHPELLDVVEFGCLRCICLKEDKDRISSKIKKRLSVLADMGLIKKDVENITIEEIIKLMEKVKASFENDELPPHIFN